MIIWDEEHPCSPRKHHRCVMCCGRLRPPLVLWSPSFRGDDNDEREPFDEKFICGECCLEMSRGLSIDLKRVETAKKVEHMDFHRTAAKRAAVSGGFLYTTGTNNKQ